MCEPSNPSYNIPVKTDVFVLHDSLHSLVFVTAELGATPQVRDQSVSMNLQVLGMNYECLNALWD